MLTRDSVQEMKLAHRVLAERNLKIELTDAARRFLAAAGYDPTYGARPLKRAIQQYIQDLLAMELLEGHFRAGDSIVADLAPQGDRLTFARQVVAEPVTS